MTMTKQQHRRGDAVIEYQFEPAKILCRGDWTIRGVQGLEDQPDQLVDTSASSIVLDGEHISKIDSTGAMLLFKLISRLKSHDKQVQTENLNSDAEYLLKLVEEEQETTLATLKAKPHHNSIFLLGKWIFTKINNATQFITFMGHFVFSLVRVCEKPRHFPGRAILATIEETGYQAVPIVALLSFLVGVVLSYQIALQLQEYGANIYIVDVTGMIIFREFGPLIAAIITAGRSGTAFTAQIGTMKVNEELDALETMGIPPMERIVVPKLIGLLIALPLLTVWSSAFGILGAMIMAKMKLGISYFAYLSRFQHQIEVRHYLVGLIKAPFFAIVIALVGCFQGMQVEMSAESVGRKTTQSAVQAIFLIIVVDALFSILFSARGI